MKRVHLIVTGIVHGVGFRYNARRKAELWNLTGYARNLYNGSVEIEAQGTPENIERLITWANHGPADAKVDSVMQNEMSIVEDEIEFEIR